MVFVNIPDGHVAALSAHLAERRILACITPHTRLVTHLDAPRSKIEVALQAFRAYPGWAPNS